MRTIICIMLLTLTSVTVQGQDFSLISGIGTTPSVTITSTGQEVIAGPLKTNIKNISIIVTDFADIKNLVDGQKAVFLGSDIRQEYNGILLKVETPIENPLLRVYKRPQLFPPASMKKYSDNEWFYYGSPGKYVIEYLDNVNGNWVSEFIEAEIKDNPGNPGNPGTGPDDPGTDPDEPGDDNPPSDGSYANIRSETTKMVKAVNDPAVANSLVTEYTTALNGLSGSIDQMRAAIRTARREAFQKVASRNTHWNDLLLKVDQMMIDAGVDTAEKYKAAITAYVNGIKDALR